MKKFLSKEKRKIAVVLLLSMILANIQPLVAAAKEFSKDENTATYYDIDRGCEVKLVYVNSEIMGINQNEIEEEKDGHYEVYENDEFSYSMEINLNEDIIEFHYANGETQVEKLSKYIVFTEEEINDEEIPIKENEFDFLEESTFATRTVDVVDTIKESVNPDTGLQDIPETQFVNGYKALGCRGGYWYAPEVYGYLQRVNSGYYISHSFRYDITKGTQAAVAAAAIYEILKKTSWKLIAISVVTNLILAVYGTIIDAYETGKYEIRTYRWDYRVCLNSDTGRVLGTDYRTKTYSTIYSSATGKANYQYNGNAYDGGFPLSNAEMIKAKIDEYLGR